MTNETTDITIIGGNYTDKNGVCVLTGKIISHVDNMGNYLVATPIGVALCNNHQGYPHTTDMGPWEGFGANHAIALQERFSVSGAGPIGRVIADNIRNDEELASTMKTVEATI